MKTGISNKVSAVTNPLNMLKLRSEKFEENEEIMSILKPQELEIDLKTFREIPEINDVMDDYEDDAGYNNEQVTFMREKGYKFIMGEIQKVYKEDDIPNRSKFLGNNQEAINDDVVQTAQSSDSEDDGGKYLKSDFGISIVSRFISKGSAQMKSFVSQKDKDELESQAIVQKLRQTSEKKTVKEIFQFSDQTYNLAPLSKCEQTEQHKSQRALETLKYDKDYYVIAKQYLHEQKFEDETKMVIDIHKFTPNYSVPMSQKHIKKIYIGAAPAQMAKNAMQYTQSMKASTLISKSSIKCLDPSFISFIQRGKYIYFFRCGKYDPNIDDEELKSIDASKLDMSNDDISRGGASPDKLFEGGKDDSYDEEEDYGEEDGEEAEEEEAEYDEENEDEDEKSDEEEEINANEESEEKSDEEAKEESEEEDAKSESEEENEDEAEGSESEDKDIEVQVKTEKVIAEESKSAQLAKKDVQNTSASVVISQASQKEGKTQIQSRELVDSPSKSVKFEDDGEKTQDNQMTTTFFGRAPVDVNDSPDRSESIMSKPDPNASALDMAGTKGEFEGQNYSTVDYDIELKPLIIQNKIASESVQNLQNEVELALANSQAATEVIKQTTAEDITFKNQQDQAEIEELERKRIESERLEQARLKEQEEREAAEREYFMKKQKELDEEQKKVDKRLSDYQEKIRLIENKYQKQVKYHKQKLVELEKQDIDIENRYMIIYNLENKLEEESSKYESQLQDVGIRYDKLKSRIQNLNQKRKQVKDLNKKNKKLKKVREEKEEFIKKMQKEMKEAQKKKEKKLALKANRKDNMHLDPSATNEIHEQVDVLQLCKFDLTSKQPDQKVEVVRKDIKIKALGLIYKKASPLCIVFAKQLEVKIHFEDEISETEEQFIDRQLISVIYAKPSGQNTVASIRIIKNIDYEANCCTNKLDLRKQFALSILNSDHPYYKTQDKYLYNSYATQMTAKSQKKKRINKFYSFQEDYMEIDTQQLIQIHGYPDTKKAFEANYHPTKNEKIVNVADIYNTMEAQMESNNSSNYQFTQDHKDPTGRHSVFQIQHERVISNFIEILNILGQETLMRYQTFNSVIDHVNRKCIIFINNWRDDADLSNVNKLQVIEGNIPRYHRRVDKENDTKHTAPVNRYLRQIFERTKSIPYCLSINSQFKNVIKNADGIHCFVQNKEVEKIEYRFLQDNKDNQNIENSMMFYGNFLQCREDQIKKYRIKNVDKKSEFVRYAFPKDFDEVVYAIFVDTLLGNIKTQKFIHRNIDLENIKTEWSEKYICYNDMNGVSDGIICVHQDNPNQMQNNPLKVIPYKIQFKRDQQVEKPFVLVKINDTIDQVEFVWLQIINIKTMKLIQRMKIDLSPAELKSLTSSENIKISPSSNIVYIDKEKENYYQNFQISICFDQAFRIKIFEYKIKWFKNPQDTIIDLISHKEVIRQINSRKANLEKYELVPQFDTHSKLQIIGTNLLISYGSYVQSLLLKNFSSENDHKHSDFLTTQNQNGLTRIGYKRYTIENSYKFRVLLVEAHIRKGIDPKHARFLNTFEKYQILKQQIYTLLNMAPCEFTNFIDKDPKLNFDFFQSLFLLPNGQSFCHYNVQYPQVIQDEYSKTREFSKREHQYYMSLLEQTLSYDQNEARLRLFQSYGMKRPDNQISYDYDFVTPIDKCLDKDDLLIPSLDIMMEKIVSSDICKFNVDLVKRKMNKILDIDLKSKTFLKFFDRDFYNQGFVNFEERIKSQKIPIFSEIDLNLCYLNLNPVYSNKISIIRKREKQKVEHVSETITDQVVRKLNSEKCFELAELKVEHSLIDMRQQILMQKIEKISDESSVLDKINIRKQDFEITNFQVADMIVKIQEQIGDHIENMKIIQNIIDHQFKLTRSFFMIWKWMYILTYFLPFMYQSFTIQNGWDVIACNVLCSVSSLIQIMVEVYQFHIDKNYLNNYSNIIDVGGNAFYFLYMIIRFMHPNYVLPLHNTVFNINNDYDGLYDKKGDNKFEPTKADHQQIEVSVAIIFLQVALMLFAFFKIHILWRHDEAFAMLVQLLQTCMEEISSFMGFFLLWTAAFSFIYQLIGMEIDEEDYTGVNIFVIYGIQTFQNGIGNIAPPLYTQWIERKENHPFAIAVISIIWFIWLLNQLVILIVLLNFLIAIISQSYEKVNSKYFIYKYQMRAQLNRECRLFLQTFNLGQTIEIMIISSEEENDDDKNWKGFVNKVTNQIGIIDKQARSKFKDSIKVLTTKVENQIKATQEDMKQHVVSHIDNLGLQMDTIQGDMEVQKAVIEIIAKKMIPDEKSKKHNK